VGRLAISLSSLSTDTGLSSCRRLSLYIKGKGSPYSITERRVPELIPVLGSQPAGVQQYRRPSCAEVRAVSHALLTADCTRSMARQAAQHRGAPDL